MSVRSYINVGNLSLFLFVILMVAYWGYGYLSVPGWLSVGGRLHLMVLHIPIGGFVAYLALFYSAPKQQKALSILYDITVLSALVAAIAGLFLAKSGDYEISSVSQHKNLGVAFASLLYLGKIFVQNKVNLLSHYVLGIGLVLLVISGHKGAEITHGKNYLFPDNINPATVSNCSPESSIYESMISPIFEAKCISCHRTQKRKGGLVLTDTSFLESGGENGPIINRDNPMASTLWEVITLPEEDEYHMPPEGKVQLTEQEILLLKTWLNEGASYSETVGSYVDVEIFQNRCQEISDLQYGKEKYSFSHASSRLIEAVENEYLSIQPIAIGSPALAANLFVASEYNTRFLNDLLKVKEQLVQLDLSYMPLGEIDLKIIPEFKNLEKLSLNFTPLSENQLVQLNPISGLQSLSIAGLLVGEDFEEFLENHPNLRNIYLGTFGLSDEVINRWKVRFPQLNIQWENPSNEVLPLTPPVVSNKKDVYQQGDSLYLTSPVPGATIKYTLDGSAPDTLKGVIYTAGIPIKHFTKMQAIVLKEGWEVSPELEYHIFLQGLKPDSSVLQYPPSKEYPGEGVKTFFDDRKAEIGNFKDKKWIAFREKPLVLDLHFEEAISMDSIILSYGTHIRAYVFPPTRISLLAKDPSGNWITLSEKYPQSINKDKLGLVSMNTISVNSNKVEANQYKLKVDNLSRIPPWHPGKGEKGWLFVDEIFIY